uniref:phosphoribosylaminoimidazole carboxylase n=1 Tax=Phytophthora ramorum TaxID=164328 RepID=H3G4X3_PHYRM
NFAKIDTKREARTGFPEVVYAESKTPQQVAAIMQVMIDGGEDNVMASRVTPQAADEIRALMPVRKNGSTPFSPVSMIQEAPTACVLCAGTSDLPVAEEAAVTLELADYRVTRLYDVGVAGIHRLLRNQHVLRAADVAICVAGMDGALPGVVGGLTPAPVIAVPTSVGYGAAFGGLAPLLTMLNACSPGVGVVNIDNGFGAAVLA